MSLLERMRARRSVRRFLVEPPERWRIERLLEAAVTAPSASNRQPWRFLVVTRPSLRRALAEAVREAVAAIAGEVRSDLQAAFRDYAAYFTRFEDAPCVIVPLCRTLETLSRMTTGGLDPERAASVADMERRSSVVSCALAVQNLLLMAEDVGLGACCMSGPLVAEPAVSSLLGVEPPWRIVAFVACGVPAERPEAPARRPAARVTRWLE